MLSVAKLAPGQEAYYERSVAGGLDDYYAGHGESPGLWIGRSADELGLAGTVEKGELGKIIDGVDPASGARLRTHPKPRTITVERLDPETGERRPTAKELRPVAGYDLVFSAPKSVSLLHALGGEQTQVEINQAHASAWHAALAYLEEEACVTRRGKAGVVRERGSGFVAAAYQHRTSRAQDPHLHTHVIVANMAKSPDGEWRALEGEALLRTYRLAAGYLYECHLRAELSQRLGVEWRQPSKGMAELRGVPETVLAEFSQRRRQVVEHVEAGGGIGWRAAQVATVATREDKEPIHLPRLREHWRARAAEHGFGKRALARTVGRDRGGPPSPDLRATAERFLGATGLTEKQTTFSEPDLVMAWAEAHAQGAPAARIRALVERFTAIEGVAAVGGAAAPGRPLRYSTDELIAIEADALALVDRGRGADVPGASAAEIERALAGVPHLSTEQERMVRAAASSADRFVAVVGLAGAGKTTAARALARAFENARVPVLGAAPSGRAAEQLEDDTGIRSSTLHRLLLRAAREGGLPRRCLVVVDEAGAAETRVLARVLRLVEEAEGKAVLVGDPRQLPAVGAGGLFAAVVERAGALELTDNRRQRDELERQVLARVRSGSGSEYLGFAAARGRLVVSDEPLTTRARLVADWWQAAETNLAASVMIARRRHDVADLNAAARAMMIAAGRLGDERIVAAGREFRAGDRVVCRRNDDRIAVKNGTRATVESTDPSRRVLGLTTDRGTRVTIPTRYLDAAHLDYAYALTGHVGQGATVERAFVLGRDDGHLQEWGYVALSRARKATRLYVTGVEREREAHAPVLDDEAPADRFGRALESSAREELAVTQLSRVFEPTDERAGARAAVVLEAAERELAALGSRVRSRPGDELRREIAFERAALQLAQRRPAEERPVGGIEPCARAASAELTPERQARKERQHEIELEL